jgi:hypothetical protein
MSCFTVNRILRAIRTSEVSAMRTIFVENLCIDCVNDKQTRWKSRVFWDVMLCLLKIVTALRRAVVPSIRR